MITPKARVKEEEMTAMILKMIMIRLTTDANFSNGCYNITVLQHRINVYKTIFISYR